MGRKSKLSAEMIGQIETSLQNHNTVEATCGAIGISRESFYRWLREGETGRGIKADFHDTVKRAQGLSQITLVNKIASDPSWQAKAWLLERLHPKSYGRRQLIAHAGADGESDLPAAAAGAVNLTIRMEGAPDGEAPPWVVKPEQDEEPHGGHDPWATDVPEWEDPAPEILSAPDPTATAANPGIKPAKPPAKPPLSAKAIVEAIKQETRDRIARDTGGKPRDPDA